jgi:potassium/hydrogen antiporter
MTTYIILVLCILVILSYLFDITSKYTRIPGVILLIALGIGIRLAGAETLAVIPNLEPLLPVLGTVGLILIVMEAGLDLKLERRKLGLIRRSISSALIMFVVFSVILSYLLVRFFGVSVRDSLLNAIPLGIISSSVAIPSSVHLMPDEKEFVIYESSFSDIIGIIIFDFVMVNRESIGHGLVVLGLNSFFTLIIAIITSSVMAFLLHKIRYHVSYVIIMTSVILVYMVAKLIHLPALLLIITFSLVLSNNQLLEHTFANRFFDFTRFRNDLESFQKILVELTFLVRSFFFIMFGYYTKLEGLLDWHNILTGIVITFLIFSLRYLYIRFILKMPIVPLLFFSPRGLITILLFITIPVSSKIPLISESVITLVILLTIFFLMAGNIFYKREHLDDDDMTTGNKDPLFPVNI